MQPRSTQIGKGNFECVGAGLSPTAFKIMDCPDWLQHVRNCGAGASLSALEPWTYGSTHCHKAHTWVDSGTSSTAGKHFRSGPSWPVHRSNGQTQATLIRSWSTRSQSRRKSQICGAKIGSSGHHRLLCGQKLLGATEACSQQARDYHPLGTSRWTCAPCWTNG